MPALGSFSIRDKIIVFYTWWATTTESKLHFLSRFLGALLHLLQEYIYMCEADRVMMRESGPSADKRRCRRSLNWEQVFIRRLNKNTTKLKPGAAKQKNTRNMENITKTLQPWAKTSRRRRRGHGWRRRQSDREEREAHTQGDEEMAAETNQTRLKTQSTDSSPPSCSRWIIDVMQ